MPTMPRALAVVVGCCLSLGGCASSDRPASHAAAPSASAHAGSPAVSPRPIASGFTDCQSLGGISGPLDDRGTETVAGSSTEIQAHDKMSTPTSFEAWFAPTCLVAQGGAALSVRVANVGSALHNFTIESLSVDKDVAPGKTLHLRVKIPPTGSLVFFCKYHQAAGMQGAFVPEQP